MKKAYKQSKQQKFQHIRKITIYVVIQLLIVAFMIGCKYQSRLATPDNTKQIIVTVNNTLYVPSYMHTGAMFYVYADTGTYRFTKGITDEHRYGLDSLRSKIQAGDVLAITYMETYKITGKKNIVVAASKGSEVFVTISEYNDTYKRSSIYTLIGFILLEAPTWFIISLQEGWFFSWITRGGYASKNKSKKSTRKQS